MRAKTSIITTILLLGLAAAVHAANLSIDQSGQEFSQKTADLAVGDTVTFNNHDDVTHNVNVVDEDDDAADLGLQKPGEKLSYKFDKAGKFKVRCSIHPSMKLTVNVK